MQHTEQMPRETCSTLTVTLTTSMEKRSPTMHVSHRAQPWHMVDRHRYERGLASHLTLVVFKAYGTVENGSSIIRNIRERGTVT